MKRINDIKEIIYRENEITYFFTCFLRLFNNNLNNSIILSNYHIISFNNYKYTIHNYRYNNNLLLNKGNVGILERLPENS